MIDKFDSPKEIKTGNLNINTGNIITEKNYTEQEVMEIAKKAFDVFRYKPFPHNNPTWEEWRDTILKELLKIKLL